MMGFQRWAMVLAYVESENKWTATGDNGLAFGRWQMHPAFFSDYYPGRPGVDESWDSWFLKALSSFYTRRMKVHGDERKAMMEFHLGVFAVSQGQWDAHYAARWDAEAKAHD